MGMTLGKALSLKLACKSSGAKLTAPEVKFAVIAPLMVAVIGDDIYVVAQAGDVIQELQSEGHDVVRALSDYTLSSNIEQLILLEGAAIAGTGNDQANVITGNTNDNVLAGAGGADVLDGKSGADRMAGGARLTGAGFMVGLLVLSWPTSWPMAHYS